KQTYRGIIDIHRGWDRLDYYNARRLSSLPNVRTTIHETHRHDLAGLLKREGILSGLIRSALQLDEARSSPNKLTIPHRSARMRSRVKALVATSYVQFGLALGCHGRGKVSKLAPGGRAIRSYRSWGSEPRCERRYT